MTRQIGTDVQHYTIREIIRMLQRNRSQTKTQNRFRSLVSRVQFVYSSEILGFQEKATHIQESLQSSTHHVQAVYNHNIIMYNSIVSRVVFCPVNEI